MFKNYRNASNYHEINEANAIVTGENYDGQESVTIPDQVFTLRDLIERHASGQIVPIKDAQYDDDLTEFQAKVGDLTKLTKLELIDYAREINGFITSKRELLEKYNKEKATKVKEAEQPTPE
jgi:hypothetical protein